MADVDLIATKDFSYSTRRLKAGDAFSVPATMAKVLIGIGKAEHPRVVGTVAAPPARIVAAARKAAPAKPKTTRRRATKKA